MQCDISRRRSFCCNHRQLQPPILPTIITATHFYDVQSTLEKSFVSFQHFPPPSSLLPGSRPLMISAQPTMLGHSLSTIRFLFHLHLAAVAHSLWIDILIIARELWLTKELPNASKLIAVFPP